MSECETNHLCDMEAGVEAEITRSLEQKPAQAVPADFALRVRQALPAQPKPRRAIAPVARRIAIVAALILTLTMFAVAPHATPTFSNFAFDFELLLLVQLAGVASWFAIRREA